MPGTTTKILSMTDRFRRFQIIRALRECTSPSIYGIYIRKYIGYPDKWDTLIASLKDQSGDNPRVMMEVIGEKAYSLLTQYNTSE